MTLFKMLYFLPLIKQSQRNVNISHNYYIYFFFPFISSIFALCLLLVIGLPCFMSASCYWTSLVAQTVKRLPTMRETRVQSLGWEDLLEKEMVTHSSILAWEIPWTEEPGWLQSMGSQRVLPSKPLIFPSMLFILTLISFSIFSSRISRSLSSMSLTQSFL